jgi:hypothetical protein
MANTYTGRDTTNRFQELTTDLRKLRDPLEDIEEHVAEGVSLEPSSCRVSTQISPCEAILCGLI